MKKIHSIYTKPSGDYTVIFANGDFPVHPIPLRYLSLAPHVVCCDGAADAFLSVGILPDAIVGDCDSISDQNKERFASILYQDSDQYCNDLTKSINYCVENNRKNIVVLAASGKREDHALGNISLLIEYMDRVHVTMITDFGVFTPIAEKTLFKSIRGQQVSIFSFDNSPVNSENLRYPLQDLVLDRWWKGTLNESLGDEFTVDVKSKSIVFRAF